MPYSFQALEFDKVLILIQRRIKTFEALKILENLKPIKQASEINDELNMVHQMMEFLQYDATLSFEPIEDASAILKNSQKEGYILDVEEILSIKQGMGCWKSNFLAIKNEAVKYPLLYSAFQEVRIPENLLKKIFSTMDDQGQFFDHASEELRKVRRKKTTIRQDIQNRLNTIINSSQMAEIIQEKIIAFRDGRFVIPVRSQFKNKLKSEWNYISHSFSKSGETTFVEPAEILHLNNELVDIDEQEWIEIRRILKDLTLEIGKNVLEIEILLRALGKLEFLYAKACFAKEMKCGFPEVTDKGSFIKLLGARHPLLGLDSVPITVDVGESFQGLIISGPNAGGKTVALKTIGLLTNMVLCGIPIPAAEGSKIGLFSKIMVEIGDEQSISENLSSFSGHILGIARILNECGTQSLVLIDEIASSTEPKEGEALGREIIREILSKGAKFIITTHYQGIKELGYIEPGIKNAFVEFDEEKLIPLYRLRIGSAGGSYALSAAKKYGLSEPLIKRAREYLEKTSTESEKLLRELEAQRNLLAQRNAIVFQHMEESREIKKLYEKLFSEMEEKKREAQKKGTLLLQKELDDALREIAFLKEEMRKKRVDNVKKAEEIAGNALTALKNSQKKILQDERKPLGKLSLGERVYVGSFQKEGNIEEISGEKVKVRLGLISTVVNKDDLYAPDKAKKQEKSFVYHKPEGFEELPYNIDIRGKYAEEALKILEKNLELAVINGVPVLHVIHGKGEGILRKAVWEFLKNYPGVKSFHFAKPEEGGQGKTIVILS